MTYVQFLNLQAALYQRINVSPNWTEIECLWSIIEAAQEFVG